MSWTDERIDQLRTMWDKGMSASQIAEQLGNNITRNAVIGKAHRLGLKSRPSPVKADSPRAKPAPAAVPTPTPTPTPPLVRAQDPEVAFARAAPVMQRAPMPMMMPNTGPVPPTTTSHPMANRRSRPDMGRKITLLELTEKVCKWPIGHPDEEDFHFCGAPVNAGTPYCLEHCAVAYQSQLPRKDKMRPLPMPRYRV
jgi:GcrA cell cycle regulator